MRLGEFEFDAKIRIVGRLFPALTVLAPVDVSFMTRC